MDTHHSSQAVEAEAHLFDVARLEKVGSLEDLFRWHAILFARLLEGGDILHQLEVASLGRDALDTSRLNPVDQPEMQEISGCFKRNQDAQLIKNPCA